MIEKIIEFSSRNRFFVFLVLSFGLAWGLWSLYNIPLDAIPDLSDVQVIVHTEWPGRSPDLLEDQITYPIVTAMIAAPRVQLVRGISDFGNSFVYIIFEDGTDMYWARSRVLEYMQGLQGKLPQGTTPVLGPDATGVGWVFEYALVDETGRQNLAQLRSFQDWYLRYWLEAVPGVAQVASVGGFVKQYQVQLDPDKLLAYGIPIGRVIDAIRRSNNDVGGRVVEIATTEYMVRGRGYIQSLADIESIPVGTDGRGTPVQIRDVGLVQYGPDMRRGLAELDGRGETVGGIVIMRYGENALNVVRDVKTRLDEVAGSLPEGVKVVTTYDRSVLIERAIATLTSKLSEEMLVVSLVIIVFLLHLRTALILILALPMAVLFSFIPLYHMGLTANIMSLGGIAIAIGAMVDASIVLVENAHKNLENWELEGRKESRIDVLIRSFQEVGPSIFFALLVITVSFIPVFTLQAQEGRLFRPLAYTKTFSMLFAAFLAVTLVPALAGILIRGRIRSEEKHPVSRLLHFLYGPVIDFVLRYPKSLILLALLLILSTVPVYLRLGSEFMPPLNEGSLLFMPTAVPGMPISEAVKVLQIQDRILAGFPEVVRVFGKIGRAETPTDPAPLSMAETIVLLRPQEEWEQVRQKRWYSDWPGDSWKAPFRFFWPEMRPKAWNELVQEMDAKTKLPGMANIWWMPVQTRTEMLSTGMRSNLGIKVFGPDLGKIEEIAVRIEEALQDVEGTRSVFADRTIGGYYLDFKIFREEAARYGLTVEDVTDIIETAVGGKNIDFTIEGRERYPINVRYLRELRDDPERLERVLVSTPTGSQVPISLLSRIEFTQGPSMIRDEDGQLVGYVFVDVAGKDFEGYVERARRVVSEQVSLPPGYRIEWAGQYQYLQRMKARLLYVVPLTLFLIFVLLYINFSSWKEPLIVLLAVPFSLIGSFWLLYLLDYNLSVAVWVGIIALAGIDAETGVVMLLYLQLAHQKWQSEGRLNTLADLREAIHYGAVKRVRPKVMTVLTTTVGLLPIMWAPVTETGADAMKRMAAPMVGGLVTSFILELTIYPAIFVVWKQAELQGVTAVLRDFLPSRGKKAKTDKKPASWFWKVLLAALAVGALLWVWIRPPAPVGGEFTAVVSRQVGSLQVEVAASSGVFRSGRNTFRLSLKGPPDFDFSQAVPLVRFSMPAMGAMPQMLATAALESAGAGVWLGDVELPMAGQWRLLIEVNTANGKQQMQTEVTVQ